MQPRITADMLPLSERSIKHRVKMCNTQFIFPVHEEKNFVLKPFFYKLINVCKINAVVKYKSCQNRFLSLYVLLQKTLLNMCTDFK